MQHLSTRLLKFCAMCLLLLMMHNSKAQYVTIPDPVFATWLNANGFSGCITGNQLDTTCPAVLSATIMRCYAQNIHDLTGIQYFKNLDSLDCSNDSISFIPALPPALRSLNCQLNSLTNLPALPASIRILNCNADQIINLPQLPAGMLYLDCENNKLTGLPALPASLRALNCIQNQLTSLPALPSALTDLACDYNQLTALPALPSGLINLACSYNQLTALPALPSTVSGIYCTGNRITSLPALPAGLLQLFCIQNNLTALPPLPPTLIGLYCYINQITSLPVLPSTLIYLSCDNNRLTSIPALPPQLFMLACNHNLITSLPALPPTVVTLQCGFNQLISLPDLPDTLNTFYCNDNPNLACLPQLKKVHDLQFQNTAVTCLPDYGKVDNSTPALGTLPLCGIFNPGGCGVYWNISGRTFYDVNNNCTFDSIDIGQNYVKVTLDSAGNTLQQVFTGGEGFYSFQTTYGNYKLTVDTANLPFVLQCPDSGYLNSDISATDSLSYNNDFSFRCRTLGFDLGVRSILNDYLVPRPNDVIGVNFIAGDISELYGAHCASGIGGRVQISFNGPVTYAGPATGALTPTTISSNLLTYNIADFGMVNDFNAFNGLYQVNANAAPNAPICFTVTVTPATGDYNPANNTLSYCFSVLDAIDPNEKEVYPAHIDSAGQWLTYTIRFQNTGTAPALNIRVTDTLDNNLDPSTFQLLAYSAKNITQLFGNDVVFNFPNINLPDSATGNSASRGYVQYRVKTKSSIQPGTIVRNTASIYFDLNSAVVTNTVIDSVRQQPCTRDTINLFGGLCAGDSVYFYGTYIHSPGTYDTLLTGGCDTVAILTLVVQDPLPPTWVYDTICANDSVLFNGRYVDTTGSYTAHYNSSTACDSSVILRLTVNALPVVTFTLDSMQADGDFYYPGSYIWCGGNSPRTFVVKGGNPAGGIYSGRGIFNDIFISDSARIDTLLYYIDVITYSYMGGTGCIGKNSVSILLNWGCEGINEISINSSITLYPNPATNQLFIKTENIQPQSIILYDVDGRLIFTQPFTPELNINPLSTGVYFIEVKSKEGIARKRFVKM